MEVYLILEGKKKKSARVQPTRLDWSFLQVLSHPLNKSKPGFCGGLRMNDPNPTQKYRKQKWHRTTKFVISYWTMLKKKFHFTHVSARMNLILLFEDTTSISISGPLSKERRIAAHANPEMSRTVMQLQWCTKIESWAIFLWRYLSVSPCFWPFPDHS